MCAKKISLKNKILVVLMVGCEKFTKCGIAVVLDKNILF
jgi:hypothetical protein